MNKIRTCIILLCVVLSILSCGENYDDTLLKKNINDLSTQIETGKFKSWCNLINSQISALQGLVSALEKDDIITGVTQITAGTKTKGYTILFSEATPITIVNNEENCSYATPVIGTRQDSDGIYGQSVLMAAMPYG